MPPQQSVEPSGIEWHKVTWYSRLGALLLFLGVIPALCFYIGVQYESIRQFDIQSAPNQNTTVNSAAGNTAPVDGEINKYSTASSSSLSSLGDAFPTHTSNEPPSLSSNDRLKCGVSAYNGLCAIKLPYAIAGTYFTDGTSVYYGYDVNKIKLQGADSASFKIFSAGYGGDANTIYYKGQVLLNADAASFKVIIWAPCDKNGPAYAGADKNHIYNKLEIIPDADMSRTDSGRQITGPVSFEC